MALKMVLPARSSPTAADMQSATVFGDCSIPQHIEIDLKGLW